MPEPVKQIPKSAFKEEVFEMYSKLSRKYVRSVIHEAIDKDNETRDKEFHRSHYVKTLLEREIIYIVETLGTPDGYLPLDPTDQ